MERQKIVKNIGRLNNKILVFGGVYSNLQALNKLQEIANSLNIPPSNIICTGDIVGYCAQPEECVQLIMNWEIHSIAGNVEIQLREGQNDCGCDFTSGGRCDTFSRQWYAFAKRNISHSSIQWMNTLPDFIKFSYANHTGIVIHGSWHETSDYIFKSTEWGIKEKNFQDSGSELVLAGHCGLPFSQNYNQLYWLNSGVIGMPANDGSTKVWYMILDITSNGNIKFEHKSFGYDYETTAYLMQQSDLPVEYARTLKTGIWDNCEILPKKEIENQGLNIEF